MYSRLISAATAASLFLSVLAIPRSLNTLSRRAAEGEPFPCEDPDPAAASAGKQNLINAGAQSTDLAIAMLENGCAFTGAFAAGNGKVKDAAELGVYRNNWYMLRTYCDHFKNASPDDWFNLGQQAHNDVGIATQCQRQCWDALGPDQFFGLQRGGVGDPGAGAAYGQYVYKYNDFVQAHMTDGMAIYYNVPSM